MALFRYSFVFLLLLSMGCGGGMSQDDMRQYARRGGGDDNDPPRKTKVVDDKTDKQTKENAADETAAETVAGETPEQQTATNNGDDQNPAGEAGGATSTTATPESPQKATSTAAASSESPTDANDEDDFSDEERQAYEARKAKILEQKRLREARDAAEQSRAAANEDMRREAVGKLDPEGDASATSTNPRTADRRTTGKLQPPAKDVLAKTMDQLKEIYQASWNEAIKNQEREEFAKEIRDKGNETTDSALKYALLITAMRVAANADDPSAARDAVRDIEEQFEVDIYGVEKELIDIVVKRKSKRNDSKKEDFLAEVGEELFEEAFQRDNFDDATLFFGFMQKKARLDDDQEQMRELAKTRSRLEAARAEFKKMKRTLDPLIELGDPKANTVAGSYQCFVKGNWSRGLAMLAQGPQSHPLTRMAEDEITGAPTGNGWIAIADRWWDYAEEEDEFERDLKLHAAYIYEQAIPAALDGVERLRAEIRLKEVRDAYGDKVVEELDPNLQRAFSVASPRPVNSPLGAAGGNAAARRQREVDDDD